MRIVGGEWRGRPIDSPKGRDVSRPTTDRVREAVASMLESALIEGIGGSRVLDAFAGSGALGLEMLSRGAAHVAFFDVDRGAAALVKRNLAKLSCAPERSRVVCGDAISAARRGRIPGGPFDAVLIDPPYALGAQPALDLVHGLVESRMLASGTIVLFERTAQTPPLRMEGFETLKEKRYGQTCIDVLRYT